MVMGCESHVAGLIQGSRIYPVERPSTSQPSIWTLTARMAQGPKRSSYSKKEKSKYIRPHKGAGPSRATDIPEPQNRDANVAGRECVGPSRSPMYPIVRSNLQFSIWTLTGKNG